MSLWKQRKKLILYSFLFISLGTISYSLFVQKITIHDLQKEFFHKTERFASNLGFVVKDIAIFGRNKANQDMINILLRPLFDQNIFLLQLSDISKKLNEINWIDNVAIRRTLPHKLNVYIVESKPVAIWQHKNQYMLIDHKGHVLQPIEAPTSPAEHILITGKNAPDYIFGFLQTLRNHSWLSQHVKGASLVHKRRWNIYLNNDIVILLPEKNIDKALIRATKMLKAHDFLWKNIKSIDLRIESRFTIKHKMKKIILPSHKGKTI